MRRRQKLDLHKNTDEQLGSIAEDRQVLRDKKKKKKKSNNRKKKR